MSEPVMGDEELTDTMRQLAEYMRKRDQQRADDLNEFLSGFTPRERSLMRDVAVMAFVQGTMHVRDGEHPKDSDVFAGTMYALLREPDDRYPAVLRGATYTEQGGGTDGA